MTAKPLMRNEELEELLRVEPARDPRDPRDPSAVGRLRQSAMRKRTVVAAMVFPFAERTVAVTDRSPRVLNV